MNYYTYVNREDVSLFTIVCFPDEKEKYPVIVYRTPYVEGDENKHNLCNQIEKEYQRWLENGYGVIFQHCRGRGESSGDFIPYIFEREDGLALQQWIRKQPFYNGEIYLAGASYTSSVHFVTTPFAEDIKGAILEIQDCNRYNCNYRHGFYKVGLHGNWYVQAYKKKSMPVKNYTIDDFSMLPLIDFSQKVLGEKAEDFDEILLHPQENDDFWKTRYGGGETIDAIKNARIPLLIITGFYDIYTGGIFTMWNELDEKTRQMSSLVVHPYAHDGHAVSQPVAFEHGEVFHDYPCYDVKWVNAIRKKEEYPFSLGLVTYYPSFSKKWLCDSFKEGEKMLCFPLGVGEQTYQYNPQHPAKFVGGLSTNFAGTAWQIAPHTQTDVITVYTPEFSQDCLVKGKMKAHLVVKSDCEDTCFYVRLSLVKENGDYGLRDDIQQISNVTTDYVPNQKIGLDFLFDEHAFYVKKGEKIRIDISSSAKDLYVPHTNYKGLFSVQTKSKIATNTIVLSESNLTILVKK